jgi:hypothetical protein
MSTELIYLKPEVSAKVVSPIIKKKAPPKRASLLRSTNQANICHHKTEDEHADGSHTACSRICAGLIETSPNLMDLERYGKLVSRSLDYKSNRDNFKGFSEDHRKFLPSMGVQVRYFAQHSQ